MSKLSQSQKVVQFLRDNPKERFNARTIAEAIVSLYPEDYAEKRNNPRFVDEKAFITQIVAEIGAQKDQIANQSPHVFWQDKPRPRLYWYNPDKKSTDMPEVSDFDGSDDDEVVVDTAPATNHILSEHELYPLLIEYLKTELKLYCLRIDEKRSRNSRGSGGNQWLHPDIVAMQPIDKEWNELRKV